MKKNLLASLVAISAVTTGCGGGTESKEAAAVDHVGKATYDAFCKVCHAQGLNGAPILGNQAMWGPRVSKGKEALAANAADGFGLMPANLGRDPALDQAAIGNAVDYMLSEL